MKNGGITVVVNPKKLLSSTIAIPEIDWVEPEPDLPLTVSIGSGSTGRPKKIQVSHQLELQLLHARVQAFSLGTSDVIGHLSAMEFVSARRHAFSALYAGGSIRLLPREGSGPVDALPSSDISVLQTSVVGLHHLLDISQKRASVAPALLPPRLRILSCGGSVVSEELRSITYKTLTDRLHIVYGANEFGFISVACPDDIKKTPGTVGRPVGDTVIEIVDGNARPLAPGQIGAVRIRGNQMIDGYLNDPENTKKHFRDGWFYPGDIGKLTSDGQLVYCGRSDDMMIFNATSPRI